MKFHLMRMFAAAPLLCAVTLLLACGGNAEQEGQSADTIPFDPEYSVYSRVLAEHVEGERVDYVSLKENRAPLDTFITQLASLGTEDYEAMSREEKIAFWINAYNGITLRSIVDAYPVASIKDIDGVWTEKKWPVAGRELTLDGIEHDILRPEFGEARIHFAVNCAAIGCPPLHEDPYFGAMLDSQLTVVSENFVNHPTRNQIDVEAETIRTSMIFQWFGEDFVPDYGTDRFDYLNEVESAMLNFMYAHASETTMEQLNAVEQWSIEYMEYDWSLNDIN